MVRLLQFTQHVYTHSVVCSHNRNHTMLALEETLRVQPTAFCVPGNKFFVSKYRCFGRTACWFLFSHFNFTWWACQLLDGEQISLGKMKKVGGEWRERVKQRGYKCTEDNTSSAVPQVLPLTVLLPLQWLHPVQTPTIMSSAFISAGVTWGNGDGWAPPIHHHSPCLPCGNEHRVSGWCDHWFLRQNGTHPGLEDSNQSTVPVVP